MVIEFVMPKLGTTMTDGAVTEWHIKTGDYVAAGDLVASVESNKATVGVEAAFSGYLRSILVDTDETVPIGTVIAYFSESLDEPL